MSVDQFRESIRERYGDTASLEYEAARFEAGGYVALGLLLNDHFYCAPRKFKGVTRQTWRLAVLAPRSSHDVFHPPRFLWGDGGYSNPAREWWVAQLNAQVVSGQYGATK